MRIHIRSIAVACTLCAACAAPLIVPAAAQSRAQTYPLSDASQLELHGVAAGAVTYHGRNAVRLVEIPDYRGHTLAVLAGSTFRNGTIEIDVAGRPGGAASADARGFVGVAFRAQLTPTTYEAFYIRPTNGRADDQLRRNHSTQYISEPLFPWERLRKESPGVYESYVDLETGEWTRVRIVVSGVTARLYVHGAAQPALIVNDLKLGERDGALALWIGAGTEAWFSNLRATP